MSSNSIFTSANSEERWVLQIAKNFVFHEHVIEIDFPKEFTVPIGFDIPYCVFKVPKTLTETKPEAYTPQKIGLGPYHHLRPELYIMHKHKLSAVTIFLNEKNLNNIHKAVEALIQHETVIRACYDQYLDLDAKTLAWIVAIDGLYLLQFLRKFSSRHKTRDEFSANSSSDEVNVNDDSESEEDRIAQGNSSDKVNLSDDSESEGDRVEQGNSSDEDNVSDDSESEEDRIQQGNSGDEDNVSDDSESEEDRIEQGDSSDEDNASDDSESEEVRIQQGNSTDEVNVSDDAEFEEDILMLENQIPMVLLKVILLALGRDHILIEDFGVFCQKHSPFQLYGKRLTRRPEHLLDYLHDLIVNNQIIVPTSKRKTKMDPSEWTRGAAEFAGTLMKVVTFYQNVPMEEIKALPIWAKIKAWIKKHDPDEQNPLVEQLQVPSVTKMSEVAGIAFTPTPGGIRDVDFKEPEKKFYLPVITVNVHTETVLRNLVAYELSIPGLSREFTLYVDLMCGIINTKKDVEILKNAGIIKGGLPDDDIVRIFNGIRRSTDENDQAVFNIRKAIDGANVNYGNVWSVKVKRFVKKYFSYPWKHIRVVVSMVVVLLLTLQAYCSVFGCARWFGGSAALKGGHFLYTY